MERRKLCYLKKSKVNERRKVMNRITGKLIREVVVFLFESDHIRMQKIFAGMVFFEREYQTLFFATVERLGDDAHIATYFFAVHQF